MLDVRKIREQPDVVRRGLATKGGAELVSEVIALDADDQVGSIARVEAESSAPVETQ